MQSAEIEYSAYCIYKLLQVRQKKPECIFARILELVSFALRAFSFENKCVAENKFVASFQPSPRFSIPSPDTTSKTLQPISKNTSIEPCDATISRHAGNDR